jgi:gamma-butyrobetaine dioxygenase
MWAAQSVPTQRQSGFRIAEIVCQHQSALPRVSTKLSRSIASKAFTGGSRRVASYGDSFGRSSTPLLAGRSAPIARGNWKSSRSDGLRCYLRPFGKERSTTSNLQSRRGTSVRSYHADVSSSQQVTVGNRQFSAVYLRDACTCPHCVDPSSRQKNFQSTDIPPGIEAKSVEPQADGGVEITWSGDLPGFSNDHTSNFPGQFFDINSSWDSFHKDHFGLAQPKVWDKSLIAKSIQHVNYSDYLTQDAALFQVLQQLHDYGLVLLRGVSDSEKSVADIAERIGPLRDSFYGRTWDVKSVPKAKNVAYTAQYLGLHMDLLYMRDPPGFQFLHCLKNTCDGGSSLFSDSFHAASQLSKSGFDTLCNYQVPYHYRNAGEHYYYSHPVIELRNSPGQPKTIANVNYSPPFQSTLAFPTDEQQRLFDPTMKAWRDFASKIEDEENLYEYRLQEGECVIFNNRRVLHGRRQFDTSAGERWLKGCYIDTDVFTSRFRVLSDRNNRGDL